MYIAHGIMSSDPDGKLEMKTWIHSTMNDPFNSNIRWSHFIQFSVRRRKSSISFHQQKIVSGDICLCFGN